MNALLDPAATGRRIKLIMQLKDVTVRQAQDALGFAYPQSIYHWFDGKNLPTVEHLYALSRLLGVSLDLLLCGYADTSKTDCGRPEPMLFYWHRISEIYGACRHAADPASVPDALAPAPDDPASAADDLTPAHRKTSFAKAA